MAATNSGSRWTTTPVPTVLERAGVRRVHDPALLAGTRTTLNEYASVRQPGSGIAVTGLLLVTIAAAVLAPLLLGTGTLSVVLWAVGAAAAAFVLGSLVYTSLFPDPVQAYRKERGFDPFVDVEATAGTAPTRAGRLCDLAQAVASSSSWQEGRIDPDRLLASSLWNALRLAGHVDDQTVRMAQDRAAGLDERVLAPTAADLAAAGAELDRVETNLRELGALARELDARAAGRERATLTMTSAPAPATESGIAAATSEAMLEHARTVRDLL